MLFNDVHTIGENAWTPRSSTLPERMCEQEYNCFDDTELSKQDDHPTEVTTFQKRQLLEKGKKKHLKKSL